MLRKRSTGEPLLTEVLVDRERTKGTSEWWLEAHEVRKH